VPDKEGDYRIQLKVTDTASGVSFDETTVDVDPNPDIRWVDFTAADPGSGSENEPCNTVAGGVDAVPPDGVLKFQSNAEGTSTNEKPTINKAMRLVAIDGPVLIGASGSAKNLMQTHGEDVEDETQNESVTELLGALFATITPATDGNATSTHYGRMTHEPVMPFTRTADALQAAQADSVLAIRLRTDAEIDPNTIAAPHDETQASAEWQPVHEGDMSDVWVVFTPNEAWRFDDTITLSVAARTADGDPIGPLSYQLQVESQDAHEERISTPPTGFWQPQADTDYDADTPDPTDETVLVTPATAETAPTPLREGVAAPLHLAPESVYDPARRVWIPVPPGVNPAEVRLYYYHPNGNDAGWYPAENVQGWLVPDSYLHLRLNATNYLGFLVKHAGIVQLGIPD